MPKKTFTPEQIVGKLRQVEVLVSQGKTVPLAAKEAGIAKGDQASTLKSRAFAMGTSSRSTVR
jgi:hypothetical protein